MRGRGRGGVDPNSGGYRQRAALSAVCEGSAAVSGACEGSGGNGAHGAIPGHGAWAEGRGAAGEGAPGEVGVLLGGGGGRAESGTVREKARGPR